MKNINWTNKKYSLNIATIFNKSLLQKYINTFWLDVVNSINDDQHILINLRLQFDNDQILTIGELQKLNKNDKDYLINYLLDIIELKTDTYITTPIISIIFSYGIREGLIEDKIIKKTNYKLQSYYNNKLPVSFNPLDYGQLLFKIETENKYVIKHNDNVMIVIKEVNNNNDHYNLIEYYKNNNLLYKWKDVYINDNTFERHLGKTIYTFENNEVVLLKVIKPIKYISKSKTARVINNKFITMDLETYKDENNKLIPYLLCWYDGNIKKSYFINDYNNFDALILKVMNDLCTYKYKNYKIYLHNFSKFDGIFLLKHLANIKNSFTDPIINNGKIINIHFTFNNITLHFRDSLLLLPSSLKSLGKSFNCIVNKDTFPILLNDINYHGQVPKFSYFNNITIDEYLEYGSLFNNKEWNFKSESINYCLIDCITLYEILIKFNSLIFGKFNLNINNYPTLPSLSFGIYRTHYMKEDTIPGLTGDIYNFIRDSYTGGSVDMFIPFNNESELIYCYDVNSLYPSRMLTEDMPVGNPIYFKGDIRKYDKDAFGFFKVIVETPKDLKHPIIQIHHKAISTIGTKEGVRTVSPLGNFEMIIFSREMDNAMKLGYKFKIIEGYLFDKGKIFNEFINDLYKIRLQYPKTDHLNYIAKILMNSLYGRFGMDDNFNIIEIINKADYSNYEKKFGITNIIDIIDLDNTFLLKIKIDNLNNLLDNGSIIHNINIAIASAITAESRIHMSKFKNNNNYKLFYSDTDSIYINKSLNEDLVSNKEIGKMKLEYICSKGIFLAPKVYGLITNGNIEIIKVKGLTKEATNLLSIEDFEELLIKDKSLEINQEKWYKSLDDSSITIKDQLYNLKVTCNKRQLVYDQNNKLVNTKPILLN